MTHFQLFATAYSIHLVLPSIYVGRNSAFRTATRLGLDSPWIKSRWGRDFQHPYRQALRLPILLHNGYRASLPEVRRPGRGFDHTRLSKAEVKDRLEV